MIVLSSEAATSANIADVLTADEKVTKARDQFITERLQTGQKVFDPANRMNSKTLEDSQKVTKMKATKNKIIRYKEQGMMTFKLLIKTNTEAIQLNMRELMTYPLTTARTI